jgi:hypothetical protein
MPFSYARYWCLALLQLLALQVLAQQKPKADNSREKQISRARTAGVNINYSKYLNSAQVNYGGVGLRFGTDVNKFYAFRTEAVNSLAPNFFSNIHVAAYANYYRRGGGGEISLAYLHKSPSSSLSFPLFMQDYGPSNQQNTAYDALEAAFKFGPRVFRIFYPKFGVTLGYRFKSSGLFNSDSTTTKNKLSPIYLILPVGFTLDLPTSFGTTGIGFFYNVGLTDILTGFRFDEGGRMRGFHIHLHLNFYVTEKYTYAMRDKRIQQSLRQQTAPDGTPAAKPTAPMPNPRPAPRR